MVVVLVLLARIEGGHALRITVAAAVHQMRDIRIDAGDRCDGGNDERDDERFLCIWMVHVLVCIYY